MDIEIQIEIGDEQSCFTCSLIDCGQTVFGDAMVVAMSYPTGGLNRD